MFVPTLRIFAEWFPPSTYASVSGGLMAMGGVGWFTAGTPLALLTVVFGWRGTFVIIGGLTVLLSVLTWFYVADKPAHRGYPAVYRKGASAGHATSARFSILHGIGFVLKEKQFWFLGVWFFSFGALLFGFSGLWAGPYLMDVYHLTKTRTGNILAMLALGVMIGSPLLGYVSDRIFRERKKVMLGSSFLLMVVWIVLFTSPAHLPPWVMYPLFLCLGIFGNGIAVVGFAAVKELFPMEIGGTAVGMVNFLPFLGAAIYQPLVGYMMDQVGKMDGAYPLAAYKVSFILFLITSVAHFLSAAAFWQGEQQMIGKESIEEGNRLAKPCIGRH